jgi:Uma2 family endonuclease
VEVEGPPDMVLEVVSDSSVAKDTQRLPEAYFAAGVGEFWLVDARGKNVVFRIHVRGGEGFRPVVSDTEGYQRSSAFPARFRLDAHRDRRGNWAFDLRVQAN